VLAGSGYGVGNGGSGAGNTSTLAGTVIPGERDANGDPLPGCPPPCMAGQQGFNDGTLSR
jgi:hypothetical protein